MAVETAFQLAFAGGILLAAATLALAAIERIGARAILAITGLVGVAATAGWVAFALDPTRAAAIAAVGLTACVLAVVSALALRRALTSGRAIDEQLELVRQELDAVVERELRQRSEELELTLARARADAVSTFADDQRRLSEERRRLTSESEERARVQLVEALAGIQAQVEQRLISWSSDLDRARQALSTQLKDLTKRQRS